MALLADTCAGTLCSRISDRPQSYASLTGLLGDNPGFGSESEPAREHFVGVSLSLVDLSNVPLQRLIDFRKREEKDNGLTKLRHNYLNRLESHLDEVRQCKLLSDKERLDDDFQRAMKTDLAELMSELRVELRDAVFSKEIIVCLAAGVGAAATAILGAPAVLPGVLTASSVPATIAGILSVRNKYYRNRAHIMKEHPMAYIYQLQSGLIM